MWIGLFFLVRKERTRKVSFIPNLTDRREFVKILGVGATAVIAAIAGSGLQKKLPKAAVGKEIVKLADFPVGSVKQFTAPDGNPAFLFRTTVGVFAYSAVCTHQGCVLFYSPQDHSLNCPCHGGKFDPANGGKVVAGPPQTPVGSYKVAIQGASIVTA
jgi:Rieske Fe-S protein